jgi:hypothetical protein
MPEKYRIVFLEEGDDRTHVLGLYTKEEIPEELERLKKNGLILPESIVVEQVRRD